MSDRLTDLQRQRALLQEHLSWLDREIAQEMRTHPPGTTLTPAQPPAPVPTLPGAHRPGYIEEAPGSMAQSARRGCIIAFATGSFVFFAVVLAAYLIYRSRL